MVHSRRSHLTPLPSLAPDVHEVRDPGVLEAPKDLRELDAECRRLTFAIEGESLAAWGVHDGDRVIVDPMRPLRPGWLVAAYGGLPETAEEPRVAALSMACDGSIILLDGGGLLCCGDDCGGPRVVGPVVQIEPALLSA
jgi:hypothetical protein